MRGRKYLDLLGLLFYGPVASIILCSLKIDSISALRKSSKALRDLVDNKYTFFYSRWKSLQITNDSHARAAASYAAKGMTCRELLVNITRRRSLAVGHLQSGAYTTLLQHVVICNITYVPSASVLKELLHHMPSLRLLRTWGSASFDALSVLPAGSSIRHLSLSFGYQQHLSDMLYAIAGLLTAGFVLNKVEIKEGQIHRGGTDDFVRAAGAVKAAVEHHGSFQGLRIRRVVVVYKKILLLDVKQVLAHPKISVNRVRTYRNLPGGYNVFDNPSTPHVVVVHD